jgi:phosphate starvation-inducible PhoH-like protein
LQNCFIVADEFQNGSVNQCKMLCTRLCEGSKLILTGDNDQADKKGSENGLFFFSEAVKGFGGSKYISEVKFEIQDVERHPVVSDVLDIFRFEGR